jgi:hypothetical protein
MWNKRQWKRQCKLQCKIDVNEKDNVNYNVK